MGDMSAIIVPKSDQINADDLLGRTITITVSDVKIRGGQEQPISIEFEGSDKVFRPCKSMCRVMAQAWGLDSKTYIGRSMTLYCDPSVKFGPLAVGGIRISHMTHIDGPLVLALTATKGVKKSYKVMPLVAAQQAATPAAAITLEEAELDLRAASSLDDLKAVWTRKIMAPHRDALGSVLEERKADLAFAGASPSPADALIKRVNAETHPDGLDSLWLRIKGEVDALPDDVRQPVLDAYFARAEALSQ